MLQIPTNQNKKRQSSCHLQAELSKVTQVIDQYTNRQFLQTHSLYQNLFSSQAYSFTLPESQLEIMTFLFSKPTLEPGQLHQFSFFHRRDKKILLFFLILKFLKNQADGGKSKMIIMENIQRINRNQLKSYLLTSENNQKDGEKLLKDYQKRIVWYYSKNLTAYKFNLNYLTIQKQQDPFLKCLIILDINTFQSSDKPTQEKYYKKLPKQMIFFSFRRDIYDYKVIQKSPINQFYQQEHGQDKYQLNDKVTSVLRKKYQGCNFNYVGVNFIVPIQYLGMAVKNIEDTYKSCLIRMIADGSGYLEFVFKAGQNFQVQNCRKITI